MSKKNKRRTWRKPFKNSLMFKLNQLTPADKLQLAIELMDKKAFSKALKVINLAKKELQAQIAVGSLRDFYQSMSKDGAIENNEDPCPFN